MQDPTPQAVNADLMRQIEARAHAPGPRIERVALDGGVFWIKWPERLDLRYRLQKGDPRKAFERERTGLREMNAAGAPVPVLIVDSPQAIVLPDCGDNLRVLMHLAAPGAAQEMLLQAARTLGAFHAMGFSHGRPSPKDMCRVDGRILMLDFERYRAEANTMKGHARDLVIFAFNVAAHSPEVADHLPEAMAAYRETAPAGTWEAAQAWCRRMRWAGWVTKPIQWRAGNKAREFKALPQLFALFR